MLHFCCPAPFCNKSRLLLILIRILFGIKLLNRYLHVDRSDKNLLLMDINQLWEAGDNADPTFFQEKDSTEPIHQSRVNQMISKPSRNQSNMCRFRIHPPMSHQKIVVQAISKSLSTSNRSTIIMASISAQFKSFRRAQQKDQEKESVEALQAMTLAELEDEVVTFGQTMKGKKFGVAFRDVGWTDFILSRYERSNKPEHMMFVRYCQLKIQEKDKKPGSTEKNPKGANSSECPSEAWEEVVPVGNTDMTEETTAMLQEEMIDMRQSNQHLHHRMARMGHLRQLSMKAEP